MSASCTSLRSHENQIEEILLGAERTCQTNMRPPVYWLRLPHFIFPAFVPATYRLYIIAPGPFCVVQAPDAHHAGKPGWMVYRDAKLISV